MNREETTNRYLLTLNIAKRQPRTIERYLHWLNRFFDYISFSSSEEINIFQAQDYLNYLLTSENKAPRTHNQCVYALRQLFEAVLLVASPFLKRALPKIKVLASDKNWFTGEQARNLIDNCQDIRLQAAIALAFGGGLRISEITHLKVKDIHKNSQTMLLFTPLYFKGFLLVNNPHVSKLNE